jgi:uncharacterized protein (TIGR03437 family)
MALADFDRDGNLDLVVADYGSDDVRVVPGDGTRHFNQTRTATYAVAKPYGIAVADFNGDGFLDIAVTSSSTGTVTIFLGNGAGGFTKPSWGTINVGQGPRDIVAADFNGDGSPDLAVANFVDGTVTILLWNKSSPGFRLAPGSPFKAGSGASATATGTLGLAVGDLDGDGKPDLAVAVNTDGDVAVFRGAGDGTFSAFQGSPYSLPGAYAIAVGDFNGDGKPDMAVTGRSTGTVQVFLGNGKGGFTAGASFGAGPGSLPQTIVAGDFNGDGKLDLAWVNNGTGSLGTLIGDGLGGFTPVPGLSVCPSTCGPFSLVAGDINHDGEPDLLISAQNINNIQVLLNGTPSVTAGSTTFSKKFALAFMACPANCTGPVDRSTLLVESDDGISWSFLPGQPSLFGSTPDLVYRGSQLYVYTALPPFSNRVFRYSLNTGTWSVAPVSISDASGNPVWFVDPAVVLDQSGSIALFFTLAYSSGGVITDPTCYPCENDIGSAVEVSGSDGAEFVLQPGWRVSRTLSSSAQYLTDPSVFSDGQRFLMYARSESGTLAYSSPSLHGSYAPLAGLSYGLLTTAGSDSDGYYDASNQKYWTYVSTAGSGIARAVSSSLGQPIDPGQFTTVVPSPGMGLTPAAVASPGFKVNGFLQSSSAASYAGSILAPESIAAAFGNHLAAPSGTGTLVSVQDSTGTTRDAQLFYVSATQVNYLIPAGTSTGPATVTITSGDGIVTVEPVQIAAVAPGLFTANGDGQGVVAANGLRVTADGAQSAIQVAQWDPSQQKSVAVPIDLGGATDQVYLILYGTGLRGASAADATITIGGVSIPVSYLGAQGSYAGLDQVNVLLPHSLAGSGEVNLVLTVAAKPSNVARVAIE